MDPVRIVGQTRVVGLDQRYRPLPLLDVVQDGIPYMISAWQPSAEELERLNRGEYVQLTIMGNVPPPVKVEVTDKTGGEHGMG